jgi:hypothetical protein
MCFLVRVGAEALPWAKASVEFIMTCDPGASKAGKGVATLTSFFRCAQTARKNTAVACPPQGISRDEILGSRLERLHKTKGTGNHSGLPVPF